MELGNWRNVAVGLTIVVFGMGADRAAAAPLDAEDPPGLLEGVQPAWLLGELHAPDIPQSSGAGLSRDRATGGDALFSALSLSYAALQILDVHATRRALRAGGGEANPLMRPVVRSNLAFLTVKAAATAAVIGLTRRLHSRNPVLAVVMLAAVSAVQAFVVAHNYRVARR